MAALEYLSKCVPTRGRTYKNLKFFFYILCVYYLLNLGIFIHTEGPLSQEFGGQLKSVYFFKGQNASNDKSELQEHRNSSKSAMVEQPSLNISLNKNQTEISRKIEVRDETRCFMGKFCHKYLLFPRDLCATNDEAEPTILIIVFSMSMNKQLRMLIRQTWGNTAIFKRSNIRVLFLLGKTKNHEALLGNLRKESQYFDDIILADFNEAFGNMTLKGITGLHVASHFCPRAKFVLKTDDDILVNSYSLLDKLDSLIASNDDKNVIIGHLWPRSEVDRNGRVKVPRAMYRPGIWPQFCSGSGFIISMDAVKKLYVSALRDKRTAMIPTEDTYITGVLASITGIKHVRFNDAYILYPRQLRTGRPRNMSPAEWKSFVIKHVFWHLHDKDIRGAHPKVRDHWRLWSDMSSFAVLKY